MKTSRFGLYLRFMEHDRMTTDILSPMHGSCDCGTCAFEVRTSGAACGVIQRGGRSPGEHAMPLRAERLRAVDHPATPAERAARGAACGRPQDAERHLLASADRVTLGRHSGALRSGHDLRQPVSALGEDRSLGSDLRGRIAGL
jgi:hypothetical protein